MLSNITFLWFCSFWSMAVNTIDKLQFLLFIFAVLLSFLALRLGRAVMHHHTKILYQILSKSVVPLRRYCDFSIFQDGGCRLLGLPNLQNFIGSHWPVRQDVSHYQILSISLIPLRSCCIFSNFKHGRCRHLGFLKSQNFISYWSGEGRGTSARQILSTSVKRLWRY